MTDVFDDRICTLGEGPFWHPTRGQLFWFDITGNRLLTRHADGPQEWHLGENVSAAGWVDHDRLIVASETALWRFDIVMGASTRLCDLEADNPATRSNDGRADPQGGFWISTMGKTEEQGAGAIWRYHRGELRKLFPGLTIPNALCFDPGGRFAHFADTTTGRVMQVSLDPHGWPDAEPRVFLDLVAEGLNPDGAVMDADGVLWLAEWGASRVSAYDPEGRRLRSVAFDAPHTSCPAFGGADMATLYCTTALKGMNEAACAAHPRAGMTFMAPGIARGLPEPQVIL